ncbi:MAG: hypothetical protein SXQ77_09545 [Halobacteria archaeon]|nr:hypothetical protein [Halobacteria archaeon]
MTADKRIPNKLGGSGTKIIGNLTLTDVAVIGLPAVVVILFERLFLPSKFVIYGVNLKLLTIPLAILGAGVGALFVYLTPKYIDSLDWLSQFLDFRLDDKEVSHEEAKEYTHIEEILPEHDAVVRSDDALVGAVHVEPPNVALATSEERSMWKDEFQDFVNNSVEWPIQIYSTTSEFPTDEYLGHYEGRLNDDDVQSNEKLAELIEGYTSWYESELEQRRMTIREHYVLVPVSPREIRFEPDSIYDKLADIPVVSFVVQKLKKKPDAEERAAMAKELDERLKQVESGVGNITGCETTRVKAGEMTRLVIEYWKGEEIEHGNLSNRIQTRPVISSRGDQR